MSGLKQKLRALYTGTGTVPRRFRYALIVFDALSIGFFVTTAHVRHGPELTVMTYVLGFGIALDFAARLWIARDRRDHLLKIYTLADVVVILTLLLDPFLESNVAFLRILRGLRLIHSYHLLRDLRRDSRFFRAHEDTVVAVVNLLVFVFVTTTTVRVFFMDAGATATPYVDALYFTVATLTTTGYGDVVMPTPAGKLFSVFAMVVGVALFVRLAQAVFRPRKVRHKCPGCGLLRHDPDAVHCKHCGGLVRIETEGIG